MHPSCTSLITMSNNGRNNGGATSGGETLDKTHNNQSLNPNGVASTDSKGSRYVVNTPGRTSIGLGQDTRATGQNTMSQHLDRFWKLDLFHKFQSTHILFVYETGPIRNIISLSFQ
jgi:hypothetical protein